MALEGAHQTSSKLSLLPRNMNLTKNVGRIVNFSNQQMDSRQRLFNKTSFPNVNMQDQSINISINKKAQKGKKSAYRGRRRVEIKPYYDYEEDEDIDLTYFIGRFDNIQPSFGYPLPSFQETAFNDDDDLFSAFQRSASAASHTQRRSINKWAFLRERLDPLKDSIEKIKRNEESFGLIYKSFTYGKKLQRKKMSKLQREKLRVQDQERKIKEEFTRTLNILINKKAKSIAGEIPGDRHLFRIENELLEDIETINREFNIKLVSQLSHKNLTYFRNNEWDNAKQDLATLNEEQLNSIKAFALKRQKEKEEQMQAQHGSILGSQMSSMAQEDEGPLPNVRDSFAIDYNPDYEKDQNSQLDTLAGGNSQVQNLTKKALAKLSQSSKASIGNQGRKKKSNLKTIESNKKSRQTRTISGNDTKSMRSYYSKSTQGVARVINNNPNLSNNNVTIGSGAGGTSNQNKSEEERLSQTSKMQSSVLDRSQFNDRSSINNQSVLSQSVAGGRNSRTYSTSKVQQKILEMKIKQFKERITEEQIEMLQARNFKFKQLLKRKQMLEQGIGKGDGRYNFRDWREIIKQFEDLTKPFTITNKPAKPMDFEDLHHKQEDVYKLINAQMLQKLINKPIINLRKRYQIVSQRLQEKAQGIDQQLEQQKIHSMRDIQQHMRKANSAYSQDEALAFYSQGRNNTNINQDIDFAFKANSVLFNSNQQQQQQVSYLNQQTPSFSMSKYETSTAKLVNSNNTVAENAFFNFNSLKKQLFTQDSSYTDNNKNNRRMIAQDSVGRFSQRSNRNIKQQSTMMRTNRKSNNNSNSLYI